MWKPEQQKKVREKSLLNMEVNPNDKDDGDELEVWNGTVYLEEDSIFTEPRVIKRVEKFEKEGEETESDGLEKEKEPEQESKKAKEINLQIYLGRGHWVEEKQATVRNFANFVCFSKACFCFKF